MAKRGPSDGRRSGTRNARDGAFDEALRAGAEGEAAAGTDTGDDARGVYMISVAARLAGMHPQTLRIYEARGLIAPKRSSGNTRLYSEEDVERLRRIQELTSELGMNLAGVERVFELEEEVERLRRRVRNLQRHTERVQQQLERELERVRRSFKRELVVYEPPERALLPARRARVRIPIDRPER